MNWYPNPQVTNRNWYYKINVWLFHIFPASLLDLFRLTTGQRPKWVICLQSFTLLISVLILSPYRRYVSTWRHLEPLPCLITFSLDTGHLFAQTSLNFGVNYRIVIGTPFTLMSKISIGQITLKLMYLARANTFSKRVSTQCQKPRKNSKGRRNLMH